MIEISYNNIMNGINKGLNMICICPTTFEADRLYRNARAIWYVKGFAHCKGVERSIEYGPEGFPRLSITFKPLDYIRQKTYKGFNGIFLIHPDMDYSALHPQTISMLRELDFHNIRYLEQWQS